MNKFRFIRCWLTRGVFLSARKGPLQGETTFLAERYTDTTIFSKCYKFKVGSLCEAWCLNWTENINIYIANERLSFVHDNHLTKISKFLQIYTSRKLSNIL
jgi:hypothetical protein